MTRGRLLTTVLLLAVPARATAQFAPHTYQIGARLGSARYAKSSGISNGPVLGMDGTYYLTRHLGVGFAVDAARPETKGEFFPAEMTWGDTTLLFAVKQPLTVLQFYGQVVVRQPLGAVAPYVMAGAGWYRFYMDPQAFGRASTFTHQLYLLGGGLNIRLGGASGIRFEVRDFVHTKFDRNRLNPVAPAFRPTRFPELIVPPEAPKSTTHNLQLALAFSFVPGGR